MNTFIRKHAGLASGIALLAMLAGCTQSATMRGTQRDKTLKGAGIGALSGAALSVALGKRKADEILVGTAIGAGIGAGVGAYMDAQEEKLARIPGTSIERVSKDTLLVHFDSDILFAIDSSTLTWASRDNLGKVAGVIDEYKKTAVVIQGHTDSTGSEAHNQNLSERRAGSVKSFFIVHGVNEERLAATGFGEGEPVASNETNDGRRQNRRVNILLKAKAV
ncbi:MAG TPA: OmpA family protein [Candidatus Polarisedimenticolia bacterium]|jgi:outer membrane protein OmpA-like peptidoglycan-associated protein|nr:OmpA family protein [Candidatus Polarisedimenticolia bacterium]